MHQARDYQQHLIDGTFAAWAAGHQVVLVVLPTGGGKTYIFARIAALTGAPVCCIAHRGELVVQIALALAREGVRHRIIGAAAVASDARVTQIEELGLHYVDPHAQVAVASVDTLVRMHPCDPWFATVRLWVQDECFPAGTLVDGRPIESISVGDYVEAYDEDTGRFERRRVTRVFRNPSPPVRVRWTADGGNVDCTLGHPVFTQRGWVPAGGLEVGDLVLRRLPEDDRTGERSAGVPVAEDEPSHVLQDVLVQDSAQASAAGDAASALLGVPGDGRAARTAVGVLPQDRSGVLQQSLWLGGALAHLVRHGGRDESPVRQRTHENAQPNASRGNAGASFSDVACDRALAGRARGQREAAAVARDGVDDAAVLVRIPTAACREDGQAPGLGLPAVVQGGRGAPATPNCGGSGRRVARRETASPRLEAGRAARWVRVDRVALHQPRDTDGPGAGLVYNLEVDGLHTYVANGFVVHNCHHLLSTTKWGKAAALFPHARGLGVTATPVRADGKGLGRHADGLADTMLVGPTMRDLIRRGYLTDYRVFAPPSDLDLSAVPISASGDFSPRPLAQARKRSHITGDVVQHYLRIAHGKLGVTFDVDVESATATAQAYRDAGVPAAVIHGETPPEQRRALLRQFRNRELLQLVNVDLFGEGFDLPAIEVVSMARPTQSYSLYAQQFGRALRPLPGKQHAIIIDHVGNVRRHGLPDAARSWSLDRRERRGKRTANDVIPTRTCLNPECLSVYERVYAACPYCGHVAVPTGRSTPEQVDGDLVELDPSVLALLRGEAARVRGDVVYPPNAGPEVRGAIRKTHLTRLAEQKRLERAIALWGGWQRHLGRDDREAMRRFFFSFDVDLGTAVTLGAAEAEALRSRIEQQLQQNGVVADVDQA